MRADLLLHAVVGIVDLGANCLGLQLIHDALKVVDERLGNRDADDLHRRQPCREGARVVLGEHAEEPLDRTEQGAVDHDGAMFGAVGAGVLEVEAFRQVEVELNGRHLPGAAQRVLDLDGDLGSVERGAAGIGYEVESGLSRYLGERVGRDLPGLVVADGLLGIPRRQLQIEIIETVIAEQIEDEGQQRTQFVTHLLASAVDVCVVLSEPSCAGQPVDHARLLVAVDGAELEETQRKFSIRASTRIEDQVVHRTVHRLQVVVLSRLAHRAVVVEFGVELHGRVHAVGVPIEVSRHLEQVALGDVRRVDELIPGSDVTLARVVLHLGADDAALRMEHR